MNLWHSISKAKNRQEPLFCVIFWASAVSVCWTSGSLWTSSADFFVMYGISDELLTFDPSDDELLTFDFCAPLPPNRNPFLNPPNVPESDFVDVLLLDFSVVGFFLSSPSAFLDWFWIIFNSFNTISVWFHNLHIIKNVALHVSCICSLCNV